MTNLTSDSDSAPSKTPGAKKKKSQSTFLLRYSVAFPKHYRALDLDLLFSCDLLLSLGPSRFLASWFSFRYNTGEGCDLTLWWRKGERDEKIVTSSDNADTLFKFSGDKVKLGTKPGKSVCAPNFEDGSLLFEVEKDPEYCDAELVFYNDPPTTSATTFETRISTTEPSTDLSTTSLIIVIVCSSVAVILLLLGLAGFIYWFYKRRDRPQPPQPRQKSVEKTAVAKDEEMVRDPLDRKVFITKTEKESRMRNERKDLEDVINRLRDGKIQSWEPKVKKKESLTSQETYDKEITEAEWRWMHRRNLGLQQNELYDRDKETEERMKMLLDAGREKELREIKTYLSRPGLYKRFLDEKDVALRRFNCRRNGVTEPTYEERGCYFTETEKELQAPLPFPIWVDWPEFQEDEAKKEESGK
ncbi:hypothetical protein Ddc_11809 [Ditylenchus destructor]|nr:hypothetical protein Ddc_11809 [Ditylenchus destructor]